MTKTFKEDSIFYKDGYIYLVEKNGKKQEGQYYCCINQKDSSGYINLHNDYGHADDCCYPVIATNNPSLEGVPCFELEKESRPAYKDRATTKFKMYLNDIINKIPGDIHNELWNQLMACILENGGQASSKKEFSLAEIQKAWEAGSKWHSDATLGRTYKSELHAFGDFKKSLIPKIKEIELEMETVCCGVLSSPKYIQQHALDNPYVPENTKGKPLHETCAWECTPIQGLKVDDKGFVIVKSVKYE